MRYKKKYQQPKTWSTADHWMIGIIWPVASSKGDKFYEVEMHTEGFDCTCPAYAFKGGKCKHIDQVIERIETA